MVDTSNIIKVGAGGPGGNVWDAIAGINADRALYGLQPFGCVRGNVDSVEHRQLYDTGQWLLSQYTGGTRTFVAGTASDPGVVRLTSSGSDQGCQLQFAPDGTNAFAPFWMGRAHATKGQLIGGVSGRFRIGTGANSARDLGILIALAATTATALAASAAPTGPTDWVGVYSPSNNAAIRAGVRRGGAYTLDPTNAAQNIGTLADDTWHTFGFRFSSPRAVEFMFDSTVVPVELPADSNPNAALTLMIAARGANALRLDIGRLIAWQESI